MPLTDVRVRNSKPKKKPYKLSDERGLFLSISPSGGKYWYMKYRFLGKEKKLSFGAYPEIPLNVAREKRDEARRLISNDVDPGVLKQVSKQAKVIAAKNTFEAIAREWHVKNSPGWEEETGNRMLRRLELYIFPYIGNRPIVEIIAPELLIALRRIESRGKIDTAHRTRSSCERIFQYAIASGVTDKNPAKDLNGALQAVVRKHFASITDLKEVSILLRNINSYQGHYVTQCALRLSPYMFLRPSELREAEWTEFDLEASNPVLRVMLGRMKKRIVHLVPLSKQVLEILVDLKKLTGNGRFVFPGIITGKERPLSNNTLRAALQRLGYSGDEMTVHGFRSTASTILHEKGWPSEAIERQLSHIQGNKVKAAYNYAEHLPIRRKMMQAWADYLDSLLAGNTELVEFHQQPV